MSNLGHLAASTASVVTFMIGLSILFTWTDGSISWLHYLGSLLTIIGLLWTIRVEVIYITKGEKNIRVEDRQ